MKCPKCGYLGFEASYRCRNCGYDFALAAPLDEPELPMRNAQPMRPLDDLELVDGSFAERTSSNLALDRAVNFGPAPAPSTATGELPLFGPPIPDDEPLITKPSAPRAPLAVRRATPEVPRLRSSPSARQPIFELTDADPAPRAARVVRAAPTPGAVEHESEPVELGARILASLIDVVILAAIDFTVVYLTMQVSGLTFSDLHLLPVAPLVAFLLLQNGGYLVVLTAGGQTIGKMATGLRIVSADDEGPIDFGRAILRSVVWAILVIPAGLGLLTVFLSLDRRGLHDRLAGTKVVRAPA